jgi:hypothetical protein
MVRTLVLSPKEAPVWMAKDASTQEEVCFLRDHAERQEGNQKVRTTVMVAMDGWDHTTPRREQLSDHDVEMVLLEVEAGQRPEWKDTANCTYTYKSYCANKGWCTREPLGVKKWTVLSSPNCPSMELRR